jgi:hypothetical protein
MQRSSRIVRTRRWAGRALAMAVILAGLVAGDLSVPPSASGESSGTLVEKDIKVDATPSPGAEPADEAESSGNPLGMFISPRFFDADRRVALATELGVAYYRTYPVLLSTWDGTCPECDLVEEAGLRFVLTVRNTADVHEAAWAPTDPDAYREQVQRVIDVYRPALIVVENEENSEGFFAGTPEEYGAQLRVACEAAHSRNTPCTNGGFISPSVKYFVYQHHVDAGRDSLAASYAKQAFEDWELEKTGSRAGRAWIQRSAREVQQFLDAFAGSGVDYLNVHWYHSDPSGLTETVRVFRAVTGLEVVSNEMGQHDRDPATTTGQLEAALDLGLPFVVWYGSDARLARGLVNDDGTLRRTGKAFRSVARSL